MRGAVPPLPHTSSCRGAYLSTGTTLPLPYNLFNLCLVQYFVFSACSLSERFAKYY